jgi:aromatic-L-amino-acid decarboxylase
MADQPSSPASPLDYHMSPDDFRRHGHALIDWIADYQQRVETLPVMAQVTPGAIRAQLPPAPPHTGESFAAMMADVESIVMPGLTHWQSPKFFAFFPANGSFPAILGELLAAGLGVQGMLWLTSPACTEVETHMMDWLVQLLDLPAKFLSTSQGGGVIQDSASSATLCALLAARERVTGGAINACGGTGQLVVYATSQTHSSLEKAMMISGLGRENLRFVPVDEDFAMRPEALAAMIAADRAAGRGGRPRPTPSTRCRPLAPSARRRGSGCTWMPPWRARRPFARSSASSIRGWRWPTATVSTPISGCSPTSTATPFLWPTGRR